MANRNNGYELVGTVGNIRTTENGSAFLSLAVRQPARNGEAQPDMWFSIAAFGPKAQLLTALNKGQFVKVEGFLTSDREHGITLRAMNVTHLVKKADAAEPVAAEAEQPVAEVEQPVKKAVRRARKQTAEVAS